MLLVRLGVLTTKPTAQPWRCPSLGDTTNSHFHWHDDYLSFLQSILFSSLFFLFFPLFTLQHYASFHLFLLIALSLLRYIFFSYLSFHYFFFHTISLVAIKIGESNQKFKIQNMKS